MSNIEEPTEGAAGAPADSIPSQHDLAEVVHLSGVVARLEQELELARVQLRDAWARVPADPRILRGPYRSDIAIPCSECSKPTRWRTGKGIAMHPHGRCEMAGKGRRHTLGIPQDVWDIIEGKGLVPEVFDGSLDDDE